VLLGEPAAALERADSALSRLGAVSRLESAHTLLVRARALLASDRRDDAVATYRQAASVLGDLELSRAAAGAWRELADAFAQLGLLEDAALAYQQALSEAVERVVLEQQLRVAVPCAATAATDDLGEATAAEAGVLGRERVVVNADVLRLIVGIRS
jgi:tetratricopeptide (TPR) repeat protein